MFCITDQSSTLATNLGLRVISSQNISTASQNFQWMGKLEVRLYAAKNLAVVTPEGTHQVVYLRFSRV